MSENEIELGVVKLCAEARKASLEMSSWSAEKKNAVLERMARALVDPATIKTILKANEKDLVAAELMGLSSAMVDRLRLTDDRLQQMAQGIREVIALPDPVGEEIEAFRHPKGFLIRKMRVPIGVIGIIYESRPNVTVDCAVLCLKSGNATVLRGGREAFHSNMALVAVIQEALKAEGLPGAAVSFIETTDRYALSVLLKQDSTVHCIIPRGGEGLIRFVAENARMPVIKHYKGVCHTYLDEKADCTMAEAIAINAKCQRPGVCNAMETLLVHRSLIARDFPSIAQALVRHGVELRVDEAAAEALKAHGGIAFTPAKESDFGTEFLDLILAVKTVDSLEEAITFINRFGSSHSDAIVTSDEVSARRFQQGVDSATVYWNASTRFTDGFEFGLGAEIGISTDKLHARGPMGLRELTTYTFHIDGSGEIK